MHQKTNDHEAKMAKSELLQIAKNSVSILKSISEGDDLPGWVSSYITLANDHLNSVQEHMDYENAKKSAIIHGPRDFEESVETTVKNSLLEQWHKHKQGHQNGF